jgi:quercetin 2,3-dioxygenase
MKNGESRFGENTKLAGNSPVDIKVSIKDTNGALSISEYTGYTKGGPPLHTHPFQDEVFIILEGEHLFQLGDEQYHLTAGDTIFIPRNVPHAPAQLSDKGKYLFFFTPSGKMEDFFRKLGALQGPPSPEEADKIFEAHGMKIFGPPLSLK